MFWPSSDLHKTPNYLLQKILLKNETEVNRPRQSFNCVRRKPFSFLKLPGKFFFLLVFVSMFRFYEEKKIDDVK